jgi:predicted aminopeptidase
MNRELRELMFGLAPTCLIMGFLSLAAGAFLYGCPQYNVYHQRMEGEAELAKAHYSKQVQIQDAQAKFEAAKSLADAEIERAKGVAQANTIIGNSLKNNESYLRYLWIHSLETTQDRVIYVPTEANLPILEAGKRHEK